MADRPAAGGPIGKDHRGRIEADAIDHPEVRFPKCVDGLDHQPLRLRSGQGHGQACGVVEDQVTIAVIVQRRREGNRLRDRDGLGRRRTRAYFRNQPPGERRPRRRRDRPPGCGLGPIRADLKVGGPFSVSPSSNL